LLDFSTDTEHQSDAQKQFDGHLVKCKWQYLVVRSVEDSE